MLMHLFLYSKKPDEVVPLESILKVTNIDKQADPYQFKVFVEMKKVPMVWTLKAHTEVGHHCADCTKYQYGLFITGSTI